MDRKTRLQFRILAPEAQRSAIRRLALSGLNDEEIADRTGWTATEVRRVLSPPEIARPSESSGEPLRSYLTKRLTGGARV